MSLPLTPRTIKALAAFLLLVLLAGGILAYRRWRRPVREPLAILPPEAGLLAGADVARMRATFFWLPLAKFFFPQQLPHDEAYDRFVAETGLAPERDLDRITLALIPAPTRPVFLAILSGRFQRERIYRYARAHGARVQKYSGTDLYRVPLDATREVWLAALDEHLLLVANGPVIEGAIDRAHHRRASSESSAPLFSTASALAARDNAVWAVADPRLWPDPSPIPKGLFRPVTLAWFEGKLSLLALDLKAALACPSAQEAYLVESNLRGLHLIATAALRNQRPRQPEWEGLLREIRITRNNSQVDVTLGISLKSLGEWLATGEKKEPAHPR